MLEESPDELHGIQGHDAPAVAVRLSVFEGNGVIVHFDDTAVGDGDFEDIGSQVLDAGVAMPHCLAVDVPLGVPDLGRDEIKEPDFFHLIPELGLEDLGECSDRQIEVNARGVPGTVFGGQSPSGNHVVDVGVVVQGPSPRMEDSPKAWKIASDMAVIFGEFSDGI